MTRALTVHVERDHLETLIVARRPLESISELIWNGLDADASRVAVRLWTNSLHALQRIEVNDDGHGLDHAKALVTFASLGGSPKKQTPRTPGGRRYHGKLGRGRFRAFYLGDIVEWDTVYSDGKQALRYRLVGRRDAVDTFMVDDPTPTTSPTGTRVRIDNLTRDFHSLKNATEVAADLAEEFALYLRQYPDVVITYEGTRVNPAAAEELEALSPSDLRS